MRNTTYLLDSFAIIELLEGSESGQRVLELIEDNTNEIVLSALSVYEVGTVLERDHGKDRMMEVIRSLTVNFPVLEITSEIALLAIHLKRDHKLPTVDCLIYATARESGAVVVSGCKHFRGITDEPDVLIV